MCLRNVISRLGPFSQYPDPLLSLPSTWEEQICTLLYLKNVFPSYFFVNQHPQTSEGGCWKEQLWRVYKKPEFNSYMVEQSNPSAARQTAQETQRTLSGKP